MNNTSIRKIIRAGIVALATTAISTATFAQETTEAIEQNYEDITAISLTALPTPNTTSISQIKVGDSTGTGNICAYVPSGSTSDMTAIKVEPCKINSQDLWYRHQYSPSANQYYYIFSNLKSGLCLDVVANSNVVYQRPCTGATSQQWRLTAAWLSGGVSNHDKIVNISTGKCLSSITASQSVVQADCGSSANSGPAWRSTGFAPSAPGFGF